MARIGFPLAMIVSAALHVGVVAGLMVMPEGEPGYALTAYRVRIVRAPARPKARQLARARETQSALEIEVPAPREATSAELAFPELDVPLTEGPIPEADRPEPPSRTPAEIAAEAPADPRRAAPSLPQREAPEAAYAEAAPSPPAPQAPEGTVAPPAPPDAGPRLELPRPLTPQRTEPPRPPEELDEAVAAVPALPQARPPAPPEPGTPSALERARGQVRELEQSLPPALSAQREPDVLQQNPLAQLVWRRYRNGIQGRMKDNYTYPAGFSCDLEARMLIAIARDGTQLAPKLLQSSGNELFDYAALLTTRRTEHPAIPPEIPDDALQWQLKFKSKECPSDTP